MVDPNLPHERAVTSALVRSNRTSKRQSNYLPECLASGVQLTIFLFDVSIAFTHFIILHCTICESGNFAAIQINLCHVYAGMAIPLIIY